MYCACMSVGKPGYSSVEMSAARSLPSLRTRTESAPRMSTRCTGFLKLGDDGAEMVGVAIGDGEIARGDGAGDEEGAGFDAVGIDAVMRALEAGDALHADGGGAGAFDLCAHGGEQRGEVGDLGLARAVLHQGFAFGKDGGHEEIFGAGDGDLVEDDVSAFELVGAGFEVAVLLDDGGAHFFETLDVQIDGTAADGAAAGHGDACHSGTGDERAEDEGTGAHGFDDLVFCFGVGERAEVDAGAVVGGSCAQLDFCAHGDEELALGLDVADLGNVFERDFFFSEDGGGHAGESGVLGARYAYRSDQRISAANDKFIHEVVGCSVCFQCNCARRCVQLARDILGVVSTLEF